MNERNIFAKGTNGETILDAFKTTQAGGSSPLLNQLFMGLNISGLGDRQRDHHYRFRCRSAQTAPRRATSPANNVGSFANWLWTTTSYTDQVGGIPRRAGYPENWIAVNPQVTTTRLTMNCCNSTYHSLQVEVNKRFSSGFRSPGQLHLRQGSGDEEGSGQEQDFTYRTLRDRSFQKRILSFSRAHSVKISGTYTSCRSVPGASS